MTNSARAGTPDAPDAPKSLTGTARVGRRAGSVVTRLQPGDVAVVDHSDIDVTTAQAMVEAGVVAVVNAAPMISGRYPSAGPEVLAKAGVLLLDQVGDEALETIRDARTVRVGDGVVLVGHDEVARGRELGLEELQAEMRRARSGLAVHLDTFTENAAEFLRREQDLVLNGVGLPTLATQIDGRPVVVVSRAGDHEAELASVLRFVREQNPVLIAVDKAADDILDAGLVPHVVVVSSDDPAAVPSLDGLRAADDVVVCIERGGRPAMADSLAKLGTEPLRCETAATAEDVALLLADAGYASLIVGVGVHADLDELLDRQRAALASTYLTRLKVGHTLVDASSVPQLYSGRTQTWQIVLVLLAGWVALGAALAVTPVGQDWYAALGGQLSDFLDTLQGLF